MVSRVKWRFGGGFLESRCGCVRGCGSVSGWKCIFSKSFKVWYAKKKISLLFCLAAFKGQGRGEFSKILLGFFDHATTFYF